MDAPSGIDLRPQPAPTVRVSKRAGIAVFCLLATVLGLFAYGGYKRQARDQAAAADRRPKSVVPATAAGTEITKEIASGDVSATGRSSGSNPVTPDLQPPAESVTSSNGNRTATMPRAYGSNGPATQPVAALQPVEPTPEEKRLLLAYQQEMQAMTAPTGIGRNEGARMSGAPDPQFGSGSPEALSRLAALGQALGASRQPGMPSQASVSRGVAGANDTREYTDQNAQSSKEAFIERARSTAAADYLKSTRTAPISKYEIKTGWEIPAVMEQGLNSDLPGELKALVTSNIFDTATGRYLLVPQGSRLVGIYDSHVGYGQDGVQVVWNRIIFPDASSIDLGGMSGQDAQGYSGFRHTVDHHYKRLIGFAVLTSLFSAGFELSQNRNQSVLAYPSTGQVAAGAVGREVTQLGAEITRRNLNVQPTIKIPVGYKFNVRVNRDILFEAPYQPLQAAQ
jgi:type IV secretion system protein VirB10